MLAKALAQRMLGDEVIEVADHIAVTSERDVGVDRLLDRRQTQILEWSQDAELHLR